MTGQVNVIAELKSGPTNWGRWGPNDELGALNFLTAAEVQRGLTAARQGRCFTLGNPVARPGGDLMAPGRSSNMRFTLVENAHFECGRTTAFANEGRFADDAVFMYTHGTTHLDALGHFWQGGTVYNNRPASVTTGGMAATSVTPLAQRGIVGHGVLVDVARHIGVDHLEPGYPISLGELLDASRSQKTAIEPHDILLVRTGWLGHVSRNPELHGKSMETFAEPGLRYSRELVEWFRETEIVLLGCDNFTNECFRSVQERETLALHIALMSRLGVLFSEINSLDELAADCASDGQYDFLYCASPLKIVEATGAPFNPLVIK